MSPHTPQPPWDSPTPWQPAGSVPPPPPPPLPPGWGYRPVRVRQRRLTGKQITGIVAGSIFLLLVVMAIIGAQLPTPPSTPNGGNALTAGQGSPVGNAGRVVTSPEPGYTPAATAPAGSTPEPSHTGTSTHSAAPTHAPKPKPTHSPKPAPKPKPKPTPCGGAPANPWGFNFCSGGKITVANVPGDVCSYFDCIGNFFNGHGYMVECRDATYSMSGGVRGACSDHGGEWREVYS